MRKVWKYGVQWPADAFDLAMPEGAEVLTVQVQENGDSRLAAVCLWALVDPDAPQTVRRFRVVGTGHPVEGGALAYAGTFQLASGALVFHVFEDWSEV
jgi:hypothetical protein